MPKHYLTTKEMAQAIDVSPSTLKRWVDLGNIRAPRTAGGHRRIPIEEAIRFIRTSGLPIRDPNAVGLPELAEAMKNGPASVASFPSDQGDSSSMHPVSEALKSGDIVKFRGVLLSFYVKDASVAGLCDGPLGPYYSAKPASKSPTPGEVAIRHRGVDLCVQGLNHIRRLQPKPADDAPRALGGAAPGDPNTIGSLMAATLLAYLGWEDTNFGASLPIDALMEAAQEQPPRLIWLTVSMPVSVNTLSEWCMALSTAAAKYDADVVIIGDDLPPLPEQQPERLHLVSSMAALEQLASGWYRQDAPAIT
ncbi:MAG: excisionase family DNA-binding protein [Phycisphaeraceae bacterium]